MNTATSILMAAGLFFTIPALLLVVYAFIYREFPPIRIIKTNVYGDDTSKTPDVQSFSTESAPPPPPIIIPSTNTTEDNRPGVSATQNSPFKKEPEEEGDPLADLLGNTHELFSGGDRVGTK
jgi:hypothetical protein